MRRPLQHRALIEQLGGYVAVAERLGVSNPSTVHHWQHRGIPAARWPAFARLAAAAGIACTVEDIERASPAFKDGMPRSLLTKLAG